MRYRIQQLGLGGILDQAIALTKNHFGQFVLITGGLCVISFLQTLVQLKMPPPVLGAPPPPVDPQLSMALLVLGLATIVITPLTNAAIVHAIARAYLGRPVSVGDAFGRAVSSILPLLWTWILVGLAIMGGFILLIIPGILCAFWFTLATQVVVVEKVSGTAALNADFRRAEIR